MEAAGAARIPVLLKVADLVTLLTSDDAPKHRHDNRQWLLDLLERSCEDDRHAVPRDHWRTLLEDGAAILLVDGLDEAADGSLRRRIFGIFRDARKRWRSPIIVTSRPIETAPRPRRSPRAACCARPRAPPTSSPGAPSRAWPSR